MVVIPLGTASATPTRRRHQPALAVTCGASIALFDCGEGTQQQLLAAGLRHAKVESVFITHLHGDHFFGLPGLLSTMALAGRCKPLALVAPEELKTLLGHLPLAEHATFPVRHVRLRRDFTSGEVYAGSAFTVEAHALDHRVFAVGYRLEEHTKEGNLDIAAAQALGVTDHLHYRALKRGHRVVLEDGTVVAPASVVRPAPPPRSFAYVTDTRPCAGAVALSRAASLVYHEATFGEALAGRAEETGHSTARQAARTARDGGAKRLLLGHFSARYGDVTPLVEEARAVFPETEAAVELECYTMSG